MSKLLIDRSVVEQALRAVGTVVRNRGVFDYGGSTTVPFFHMREMTNAMDDLRAALEQTEQVGNARCPRCWEPITAPAPRKPEQEPVDGDVLPAVGSTVWIRHGRDTDAHACTVTGYYAWDVMGGNKNLHRVFVRLVYAGTDLQQSRMLKDCFATKEAALAHDIPGEGA